MLALMTGWALAALLVLAVALVVRLQMSSARESRRVRDWLRRRF